MELGTLQTNAGTCQLLGKYRPCCRVHQKPLEHLLRDLLPCIYNEVSQQPGHCVSDSLARDKEPNSQEGKQRNIPLANGVTGLKNRIYSG